jgi:hypothetical protein
VTQPPNIAIASAGSRNLRIMVVPLYVRRQHPRVALNPCLTRMAEALWMLNWFCRAALAREP